MSVLITGGAGFIGSHLAERLVRDGFEVVILDDLSAGSEDNFSSFEETHSLKFVKGDVRNLATLKGCFDDVTAVVHLAGMTSVARSMQSPEECADVNVTGTGNVLKACVESGVSNFLYASSSAVYGDTKCIPTAEDHPLHALSPYAASKISGENLCRTYRGTNDLETVCFRFFNVYGPRQGDNGYANVITKFLNRIRANWPPLIYGDGLQTRDFIHVHDVVRVLEEAIVKKTTSGTYNVGTGRCITINYLAEAILKLCEARTNSSIHLPPQSGEVRQSQADISRLTYEFGFEPTVRLEQGLHDMIMEGPILQDL
jgi:nucleoside-diphosphate-sugar epimerase